MDDAIQAIKFTGNHFVSEELQAEGQQMRGNGASSDEKADSDSE
jgi:hypothetical protein